MKIVSNLALVFGLCISGSSFAHEGHDHGTPQAPTTPVEVPAQSPGEFSDMAAHLSFKTAHVHVMWSSTPVLGSSSIVRLELRDFESHDLLNERPVLYFGYRHETSKDYTMLEVVPAKDSDGTALVGSFDTPAFVMAKTGRYEFVTLLKRRSETAAMKTFQWLVD